MFNKLRPKKFFKKILTALTAMSLIFNLFSPFINHSFAQESTESAEIITSPVPTPTTETSPTIEPISTVEPSPTNEVTPTSGPTVIATPSATIIPPTVPVTLPPTPEEMIESTPTLSPTPATPSISQSTTETLQDFIKESSFSADITENIIKLPFEDDYPISLRFGETPEDKNLQKEYKSFGIVAHDGIDYEMPDNTNILAADRGVIISAGPGIYGTTVTIYHTWGITYYGHLSNVSVEPGQLVETGDLIGLSGHTGLSTGPHLHFGVKPKNPDLQNGFHGMVNPNIYLGLEPQSNILGASTILLNKETRFFKSSEKAEFEISIRDSLKYIYTLKDSSGKEITFTKNLSKKNYKNILFIDQPESFRPGKYTLEVTSDSGQVEKLEFYWGVLVINTNKSVYLANESAYLQMASLNEYGNTLCDSNLKLEVIDPQNETKTIDIEKSETCGNNNVTDNPDYFSHYQTDSVGTYQIKLKNLDNNFEISDSFEVKESLPFEIERVAATRINPFASEYQMTIKVKANQDLKGYIIEKKPDDFQIINSKFGWNVDMKAGEEQILSYVYQAPKISPQIFSLGPLRLTDELGQIVFSESRPWLLASDAALTATAVTTGDWNNGATWRSVGTGTVSTSGNTATLTGSGTAFTTELVVGDLLYESDCITTIYSQPISVSVSAIASDTSLTMSRKLNGMSSRSYCASGVPHNIDAAVINAGVTVTVTAAASITSVTMNNPTTANNLIINTGQTLTVTGALTLNANSTANAETVRLDGTGNISTGSIVVNAPSSSGSNNITCNSGSGTLSASGTITITGGSTASQAGTSTIAGSTCTVSAAGITINGGSVTDATLSSSTGIITTTNGITFGGTAAQAKLTTTGAGTINLTGTISSGGTLSINAATILVSTGTSAINGAYTIGKLTVSSGTLTQGAAVVAAGDVIVTSTLASGANLFTAQANYTNNGTHSGSGGVTVSGALSDINGSGTVSNTGTFIVSGATPTINSAANITIQGKLLVNGAITLTNNGTLTLNTSANSLDGDNANSTFVNAATGTLKLTGSIFSTNGILTATAVGNTVEYNGAAQTVKAVTYHHLILSGSGTKTITNLSTVNGDFTLSGTAATTNAGTLAIAGTLTATGTTFTNDGTLSITTGLAGVGGTFVNSATGILNYAGSTVDIATFTVNASGNTVKYNSMTGAQTVKATTYSNLEIDKTGQVATLGNDTVVNGSLNIIAGTLDVDVSNNYTLTVAGNLTKAGTFEARAGEVILSGAGGSTQTFYNGFTFYDLTATAANARTITITAGKSLVITHGLNISGSAGQVITLQSSSAGSDWNINTTGVAVPTLDYLYVTDSHSTLCLQPTNSSGADNINWDFIGSGCDVVGPTLDQLMRHGGWFNNGVRQPFTF